MYIFIIVDPLPFRGSEPFSGIEKKTRIQACNNALKNFPHSDFFETFFDSALQDVTEFTLSRFFLQSFLNYRTY